MANVHHLPMEAKRWIAQSKYFRPLLAVWMTGALLLCSLCIPGPHSSTGNVSATVTEGSISECTIVGLGLYYSDGMNRTNLVHWDRAQLVANEVRTLLGGTEYNQVLVTNRITDTSVLYDPGDVENCVSGQLYIIKDSVQIAHLTTFTIDDIYLLQGSVYVDILYSVQETIIDGSDYDYKAVQYIKVP